MPPEALLRVERAGAARQPGNVEPPRSTRGEKVSGKMVAELESVGDAVASAGLRAHCSARILRRSRSGTEPGPNGAGKTTLLKLIFENLRPMKRRHQRGHPPVGGGLPISCRQPSSRP